MASPLDSQYAQGVARLLYQNKRGRDQIGEQGRQDSADFETQLRRMAEQRAKTLLSTDHQANREGLFYSGQLGKRRGDVEHQYADQQADQQTAYDRRVTSRAAALNDLGSVVADPSSALGYRGTGSAAFDLGDLFNDATARQVDRDQSLAVAAPAAGDAPAPGGGASAPPAARPPVPGSPPGATKTAPSAAHGGQKWVYRQGANGTWIPVRPANAWGN